MRRRIVFVRVIGIRSIEHIRKIAVFPFLLGEYRSHRLFIVDASGHFGNRFPLRCRLFKNDINDPPHRFGSVFGRTVGHHLDPFDHIGRYLFKRTAPPLRSSRYFFSVYENFRVSFAGRTFFPFSFRDRYTGRTLQHLKRIHITVLGQFFTLYDPFGDRVLFSLFNDAVVIFNFDFIELKYLLGANKRKSTGVKKKGT